ncbi:Verru_Chthon cassette protein C [Verrucomicrobium sp. GAS474]|uniref:PulJ/GspJ family protein n=1 Tax=Verrucomicrobium sp. GAS474 TaxID=1882831 RepID=UPI00087D8E27|nr:prepilin-type N-terminal cleavage/methylation domain-containing protein [Verrucomicrobium sp. GAS474]SDU11644.1 Verru_Chthon cassette protein C [Verrucomicrobium sp. GAS474]
MESLIESPAPRLPFRRTAGGAFTLVEVLVAVSILSLLMVAMIQISATVSHAWRKSQAMADNYAQARVTLWLIKQDVQAMVLRPDLASFVDKGGAPSCSFYTEATGSGSSRPVSLVSYALSDATGRLQRGDHSLDYGTLGATLGTTDKLPDLGKETLEDIVDGVVLFKFQFFNADGTIGTVFDATKTKSVVVSLAVLDAAASKLAEQNHWQSRIRAALGETASPAQIYADVWNQVVDSGGLKKAGLAEPILSGLRIYSTVIPIPST